MNTQKFTNLFFLKLAVTLICCSCQQKLLEEFKVYTNDFSSMDLQDIESDRGIFIFNEVPVLGNFNNEGFVLTLRNLPNHDMVRIEFDLYIHNYWNGNSQGIEGPDIWKMEVDNVEIVNTTFANTPCESTYCQYQSFPENIFRSFPPRTGSVNTPLPGLFEQQFNLGWTTKYRITKILNHDRTQLILRCYDELKQENALNPHEDESWSIGNLEVVLLNVY